MIGKKECSTHQMSNTRFKKLELGTGPASINSVPKWPDLTCLPTGYLFNSLISLNYGHKGIKGYRQIHEILRYIEIVVINTFYCHVFVKKMISRLTQCKEYRNIN